MLCCTGSHLSFVLQRITWINQDRAVIISLQPSSYRPCSCPRAHAVLLSLTLIFLDLCPLCNWPSIVLPLLALISRKKSLEKKCYLERKSYLPLNSRTQINAFLRWPAATNEVSGARSRSSEGHSELENTEFCTTTRKQGWRGKRPHSPSVIHKVNHFIQLKTPLIFRNVIFELCEAAEREISFQTSIINQSLYRNLLDQNSRLVRYYGASHIFSAAGKTPAWLGKVRRLKCDAGS